MIELIVAAVLDMQNPVARHPSDCRPRQHLLRSAPPPPAFSIERFESPSQERTSLAAFRCPDGLNWRVDRHPSEVDRRDHVLGSACPEMAGWVEAAARLPIPSPALAPLGEYARPSTWFVLNAHHVTGGGRRSQMELTLIDQAGGPPNAIVAWAREGEAVFARCLQVQAAAGQ